MSSTHFCNYVAKALSRLTLKYSNKHSETILCSLVKITLNGIKLLCYSGIDTFIMFLFISWVPQLDFGLFKLSNCNISKSL